MKRENIENLTESIKEAGNILRGEIAPSREFYVEINNSKTKNEGYALCVRTDDPKLLIPSKIYRAKFSSNGKIGIIDEDGEASIYPASFFVKLEFPAEVENVLESLQLETA